MLKLCVILHLENAVFSGVFIEMWACAVFCDDKMENEGKKRECIFEY